MTHPRVNDVTTALNELSEAGDALFKSLPKGDSTTGLFLHQFANGASALRTELELEHQTRSGDYRSMPFILTCSAQTIQKLPESPEASRYLDACRKLEALLSPPIKRVR